LARAVNKLSQTNEDVFVKKAVCDRIRKIKQKINFIKSSNK